MKEKFKQSTFITRIALKLLFTLFIFILAITFFNKTFELNILGYNLDEIGNYFLNESIKKSAISYLVTRSSNAIVSIIKESEIIIGLGINFQLAIGQVLDPIDDALERLSTLLVIFISLLGTLKISFIILKDLYLKILSIFMFLLIPSIWFEKLKGLKLQIIKIILVITLLRFLIPISGLVNTYIANTYIYPNINSNVEVIKQVLEIDKNITEEMLKINELEEEKSKEDKSFFKKILIGLKNTKDKVYSGFKRAEYYKDRITEILKNIWENKDKLADAILNLMIYYLALLIIQIFLIPLGILWIGMKILNFLFNKNISFPDIESFFQKKFKKF